MFDFHPAILQPAGRSLRETSVCETQLSLKFSSSPDQFIIVLVIALIVGGDTERRDEGKHRDRRLARELAILGHKNSCHCPQWEIREQFKANIHEGAKLRD